MESGDHALHFEPNFGAKIKFSKSCNLIGPKILKFFPENFFSKKVKKNGSLISKTWTTLTLTSDYSFCLSLTFKFLLVIRSDNFDFTHSWVQIITERGFEEEFSGESLKEKLIAIVEGVVAETNVDNNELKLEAELESHDKSSLEISDTPQQNFELSSHDEQETLVGQPDDEIVQLEETEIEKSVEEKFSDILQNFVDIETTESTSEGIFVSIE